jgi:transposase
MRGQDEQQTAMFSYLSPEQRVPHDHPLRPIRRLTDECLKRLSPHLSQLYARRGRPSIAPEKLLRALLLQILYSVRSERLLMEQLDYNLLFRWFVGLNLDDPIWDVTVYTKNRQRLLDGQVAEEFFQQVIAEARQRGLMSDEHFTVDGTLVEAWAGQKSFQKKEGSSDGQNPPAEDSGNSDVNFRGEKRSNQTHQSTTDPQARLYKKTKGSEAKLAYLGHVLMENRNGLVADIELTLATGTAERQAAGRMLAWQRRLTSKPLTVGADKAYDTHNFVQQLRELRVTPHVAQNNSHRTSAIDKRTTQRPSYRASQRKRKRVEEIFGWLKTVALLRKTRYRGRPRVEWSFRLAAAAYNLVRIRNLTPVGC